jgi:O-antigen ligase
MERILKYIIWTGLIAIPFIPLIINGDYFFPFIVPKTLIFKIIVEIIFLSFLGLAVLKKEYRPKINLIFILFFLYLVAISFSSLLADSFYFSFWSNNERSEGILLLLHLFAYLFILSGFLRRLKDWLFLFEVSFFSSLLVSLIGLGQYLGYNWVVASSGGARITATIGNAGYVAGYLIFNIFFGLFLIFFRKNKYLYLYYILGILLQIFIVFNTLTRGGILALIFTLIIFIGYFVFFRPRSNKLIRNSSIVLLLIAIIFTSLVFLNKESNWVKENNILQRITSISVNDTTAKNRLVTWEGAYLGFKEKPLFGYGYENFYQVFDKHFNPQIYRHAGSVVWFDRAHNIVFDRLITGGLVGLLLYLSMLFVPLIFIWKYFYKNKNNNEYFVPVVFTLIILSYFIQNLFIFEALVTYIPLFITLSFMSQFCPSYLNNFSESKKPYLISLTLGIILFLPILFSFSIIPASANKGFIKALILSKQNKHQEAYSQFINVLDRETLGNQEYRQHFGEFVVGLTADLADIDQGWLNQATMKAEQEFDKQIEEKPLNTRNYLMFMRFLNKTYQFNVERLNKSLELGKKAIELSPTRPQLYYEVAYTQIYLGKYYNSIGQTEKTENLFNQSVENMQKAIDLQDKVLESYINMIMVLFTVGQDEKVQFFLDRMDELGIDYYNVEALERMANSAIHSQNYEWTFKFYKKATEVAPENPEYWIDLALAYAYLGEKEKAIEIAKKVGELGGNYATQSQAFIKDVLDGKYD